MFDTLFPLGITHYLLGGLLIGGAVSLAYVTTGLVTGMSSVFSSTWSFFSRLAFFHEPKLAGSRGWRLALAAGLVIGAALWMLTLGGGEPVGTEVPAWHLLAGGFIAGFGARLSNGCTSGHGICGLASLQVPSLAAVVTFLATAIVTANIVARLGGA
ncbi:MAG: YeeE/YedE family protein [Gammaproteobacteria bacterium]